MEPRHLEFGLIHYYYGEGRGKTSTLIGTIIRAIGHGLKPILIQFLKRHDENSSHSGYFMGEINFLRKIMPVKQFGTFEFIYPDKEISKDIFKKSEDGLICAKKAIQSEKYDLVALDEIALAITLHLIPLDDVLDMLKNKPEHVEIILTGASFVKELKDISNYVTQYTCIEHPYFKGYNARPGIEY